MPAWVKYTVLFPFWTIIVVPAALQVNIDEYSNIQICICTHLYKLIWKSLGFMNLCFQQGRLGAHAVLSTCLAKTVVRCELYEPFQALYSWAVFSDNLCTLDHSQKLHVGSANYSASAMWAQSLVGRPHLCNKLTDRHRETLRLHDVARIFLGDFRGKCAGTWRTSLF